MEPVTPRCIKENNRKEPEVEGKLQTKPGLPLVDGPIIRSSFPSVLVIATFVGISEPKESRRLINGLT